MDIKAFWRAVLAQDEPELRAYFAPDAYVNWHCTNEHFTLDEFIIANCEYPGAWDGAVERVETLGGLTVTVTHVYPKDRSCSFHVTSFIRTENDRIVSLDEYWADDGSAPQWRLDKHIGTPIEGIGEQKKASENKMDIELYYREAGSGEPLILLHGNGESGEYFINQIEHFQSRYRVIVPDTRGHGKSPRGAAPFTIAQFACDLYDFMQAHGIARAVILGFSDGANIAMKFAMQHPEMVKALILNGGNLDPSGVKRTAQFPIEIGYKIASRFAAGSPGAKKNAEMLGLMVNDPNISPSELAKLTMPTLVVCGTKDMIRESHTRTIAENLPNARLVILPGDHFVANKHPAEFNSAVDDFLNSI